MNSASTSTMFSAALMLLLAAGSCVNSLDLIQPDSTVVQPGQSLTITCQVSGYSLTDSSYATGWIRQREGKPMDWIFYQWGGSGGSFYQNNALKSKFSYSRDTSAGTVTIKGQNVQPEDTAVYYCVRRPIDAFDYWGKGTEVTVTSGTTVSPTLFPLVKCNPGSENEITVGCLARDFSPSKSLTFQWRDNSGTTLTSVQYPVATNNNVHTGVSLLSISKSNWDSNQTFECAVTYYGNSNKVILQKKESPTPKITLLSAPQGDTQTLVCTVEDVSSNELTIKWKKDSREQTGSTDFVPKSTGNVNSAVSVLKAKNTDWDSDAVYTCDVRHGQKTYTRKVTKAPFTVTLNQPSVTDIFKNNEVKLECIVAGGDQSIVNGVKITWEINGRTVTNNITESKQHIISSTMTRNLAEWRRVNNVRCSASSDDVTPVIQDLTVHKGDGQKPKVTVHVLQEEVIDKDNSGVVTLVCLVSSSVQQDYYIAWAEYTGQKTKVYENGINFPQQKAQNGYLVTSVYTTNKAKWNQKKMFECNVWHAGGDGSFTMQNVSKAQDLGPESKQIFDLSCTLDEEDEFSTLWSTASSFIFLFISSVFFNMIFSLIKIKKQ